MTISKKILVTGADGFIGSHLVEALVRSGHSVRALCLYNSFGSMGWLEDADDVLDDCDVVFGDLRDADLMNKYMSSCSAVLHLGALIGIPYSYDAVSSYIDTNISEMD